MNVITVSIIGRGSRHFPFATAAGTYHFSIGYSRDEGLFYVTVHINELSHAIHAQFTGCSRRPDGANHCNALHPMIEFSLLAILIAGKAQQAVDRQEKATTHT